MLEGGFLGPNMKGSSAREEVRWLPYLRERITDTREKMGFFSLKNKIKMSKIKPKYIMRGAKVNNPQVGPLLQGAVLGLRSTLHLDFIVRVSTFFISA